MRTQSTRQRSLRDAGLGRERAGASSDVPAGHRRWGFRSVAVALLVLCAALSGVSGTYAMWRDSSAVDLGSVETATASLTARWGPRGDGADRRNLLPGEHSQQTLTVTNTGDVPMELSASVESAAAGLDVRVHSGSSGAPLTSPALTTSPSAVTAAAEAAVVLDPGESTSLTAEVRATTTLTPGARHDVSLILEGAQTR